jgi:hypothetical protein
VTKRQPQQTDTKDLEAQSEQAATAEPSGDHERANLHSLVNALPPDQIDAARKFLRWLIHESQHGVVTRQVITVTDPEVEAAGDAFIAQYKDALERLAK